MSPLDGDDETIRHIMDFLGDFGGLLFLYFFHLVQAPATKVRVVEFKLAIRDFRTATIAL